jgi:rubredoxin
MPETRECPLCGGNMHLKIVKAVAHIPGRPEAPTRTTGEWICPDCDYFEEAEGEET